MKVLRRLRRVVSSASHRPVKSLDPAAEVRPALQFAANGRRVCLGGELSGGLRGRPSPH
jgi:hypothetical protein